MRCAVVSDIHCNKYALAAVLGSIRSHGADLVLNAGDTFGYYPWAAEVFDLLAGLSCRSVLGNHDALILSPDRPEPLPDYWDAVVWNRAALGPVSLDWLSSLPAETRLGADGLAIRMMHGTPDLPLTGRFYPDHPGPWPTWFPRPQEVLVLGHTHYPLAQWGPEGGLLLNPGSVGQPRDGDVRPSWMLLDTKGPQVRLIRADYDRDRATRELVEMGWNERSVRALQKCRKGPLFPLPAQV